MTLHQSTLVFDGVTPVGTPAVRNSADVSEKLANVAQIVDGESMPLCLVDYFYSSSFISRFLSFIDREQPLAT
jgi:hypothetical protein